MKGVLWLVALACAVAGSAACALAAARVRRELGPARHALDRFARELRPALLRVRDDTSRVRRRFDA